MDIDRIRELAGVVSDRSCLHEADDEVAKTILQQMGGMGRIRVMLGAKFMEAIPNGVAIRWPSKERKRGNHVEITLRPDDTYDMEFFNVGSGAKKSVKKYEGLYADALVSTFEKQTGWYLKMSADEPEGSKLEARDDEDEPEEGEPEEDDITTSDHHRWYQSGKLYFTGDEKGLQRKMNKDKFWPNVWFVSDHGNAHLVTLEAAARITKQGARKGECGDGSSVSHDGCGVNLRPGYGYRVDGTLLCAHCAEKRVGKEAIRALDAKPESAEVVADLTEDEKVPLGFKAKPVTVTVREVEKDPTSAGLQFRLSGAVYDQYLRDQIYSVNPGLERSSEVLLKAGFSEKEVEAIFDDARSGVVTLRKPIKLKTTVFVRESVEAECESCLDEGVKDQAIIKGAEAMWRAMATTEPKGGGFKSLVHTLGMKLGKDLDDIIDELGADDALREAANRFAHNMLLSETTPSFVKHCVTSVAKKTGDTQRAFGICVAQMQKSGYLKAGSMELTAAGKEKEAQHSAEPDAEKRVSDYEKVLKKARGEAVECEGADCAEDASRAEMEKALWKFFPPDSKSTRGGKKKVMFTGSMAKAAGVMDYTIQPLSDLTDKQIENCYKLIAKKEDLDEAKQTYAQAQQDIMAGLAKDGWTIKAGLKVPQALSPDASWKLFFKAQAIYLAKGDSDLGGARSLHLNDIRGGTYEKFKSDLARWTAESVEVASEFRERAGLAGAHANWSLSKE